MKWWALVKQAAHKAHGTLVNGPTGKTPGPNPRGRPIRVNTLDRSRKSDSFKPKSEQQIEGQMVKCERRMEELVQLISSFYLIVKILLGEAGSKFVNKNVLYIHIYTESQWVVRE